MARTRLPECSQALNCRIAATIASLAFLAVQVHAMPVTRLTDLREGGVVCRSVLIPASLFTPFYAEQVSRDFLKSNRGTFHLLRLWIFTDEMDARRTGAGKGATDVNYAGWRQLYEMYGTHPEPMAEMIATRKGAVMRWRDREGKLGRQVLAGADPLFLRTPGGKFEILHIAVWSRSIFYGRSPKERVWVAVYLRTADLTGNSVRRCMQALGPELGLTEFFATFRRDTWFLMASNFPIAYRFEQHPPPTETEYRRFWQFTCSKDARGIKCERNKG